MLAEVNMTMPLYLAIPKSVFDTIFDTAVQRALRDNGIKLLIVNLETETVTQWIEQ
jgi:hypothetical protein